MASEAELAVPQLQQGCHRHRAPGGGYPSSWFARVNNQNASLDVSIQHSGSTFLLTDYTLDLNNAGYGAAWKLMLGSLLFTMLTRKSPICSVQCHVA